jgi:UrcA family protein
MVQRQGGIMVKQRFALRRQQLLLAAAAAMAAASAPALAQTVGEITVLAPKVVRESAGRTDRGVPLEVVSISHHVSYGDLDLSKPDDVATFKKRVTAAAKEGCDQLDRLYPLGSLPNPSNQNCERTATEEGMAQADMVIAAATASNK